MADISDIILRIRVDIVNSGAILQLIANANKLAAAQGRLSSGGVKNAKVAGLMARAFDKVTGHLTNVERKLDAVFRAGVHMQSMGRDLLGFARKVAGAAADMTEEWGKFEFTLNRAAAAADIFDNQSAIYLKLKEAVYAAAYELKVFPAEEVAKGLYFWQSTTGEVIKTQEDLAKTMENVTAVMKLAAMTDTSYEQAIKGVYSTLKQFGMQTKDTAKVSALLFYATQKTALEFPDLIHAFKMTGAVMGQAKEPLTTMVAVLGAIGNAGFRGSQAGRALRQTYIKIVKPTKAAKAELDKLFKAQGGYNKVAFDSKGNFIGMEKYVMKLAQATKNMTYQQKAHLLATITTANELPVMTQMLRMAEQAVKSGDKSWVEFAVSQQKATEAFEKSWEIMTNSWRGVVGGLKQAVQPILLEIGNTIAKVLTPTMQELSDAIWEAGPALTNIAKEVGEAFRPMVEWLGAAVKKAIDWAKTNKKLVSSFGKWAIIGTIVAGVAGAFLLLAGTLTFLIGNLVLILVGMLPMIAVFIAAGAVIAAFARGVYNNTGGIREAMQRFGEAVMRVLRIFIGGGEDATITAEGLADKFKAFSDALTTKIADVLNWVADALNRLTPQQVEIIKDIVKAFLGLKLLNTGLGIFNGVVAGLAGNILGLGRAAKSAFPHIVTFFGFFSKANLAAAGASIAGFGKTISGAITAVTIAIKANPIVAIISAIIMVITGLIAAYETNFMGFRDFVDGLFAWFSTNVMPVINAIIEAIGPFVQSIIDAVIGFFNTAVEVISGIIDFFAHLPERIGEFIAAIIDGVANFVNTFITMIVDFLKNLWDNWSYYLGYILGFIIGTLIKIVAEIVKFGVNLISAVIDFLIKLPGMFMDFLSDVWDVVSTWFINFIVAVAGWAGEVIKGIIDWFVKLPGRVLDLISDVWDAISTWFIETIPKVAKAAGDLVTGIINFFISLPGKIIDALVNLPTLLANVFSTLLSVGGKLLTAILDVGAGIIRGIWDGVKNMVGWITDKITGFFGGLVDGIKDSLGIQSPSKVFADIGVNLIEGLAVGINKTDSAVKAIDNVMADIMGATKMQAGFALAGGEFSAMRSTYEGTRYIELSVDVTSSDASIDATDMNTLAGLITGSDMTRAIERMATVD